MKRRKQPKQLSADAVFAESSTNAFLVALETWIGRKIPPSPAIPEAEFGKMMADLDRLVELSGKPDADPERIFGQMSQALTPLRPASSPKSRKGSPLNRHERLFRAVYFFDSESYNDGVESYLAAHDKEDVRLAIDGLGKIGAVEMQARLDSLCKALFGKVYPKTEEARSAVLEAPGKEQRALLKEFARFHANNSPTIDLALAGWARANRARFV